MKASEIIKAALATHYVRGWSLVKTGETQSEYMCYAIQGYILDTEFPGEGYNKQVFVLAEEVTKTFMPIIQSEETSCLAIYLKLTDKKYQNYSNRWGHDSKACFKIRVAWWNAHIEKLESQGL